MTQDRAEIVRRLGRLDCCTLSDAMDRLSLEPAVMGLLPRTVPGRISGRVITVTLEATPSAGAAPAATGQRHLCTHAIEMAEAGDVIVVEQVTGIDAAGWGGILSNAARQKGISGVIVEGPARDIDEARDIGFPVYARSTTARTARGRVRERATAEPISVAGVRVAQGDFVAADASGVVFIPSDHIERVLDTAEGIALREAEMTKAVLEGTPVGTVMGASYENLLNRS